MEIISSTGEPVTRRKDVIKLLTGLQPREFVLWLKDRGLPATIIRTPRFDLEPLREQAAKLPENLRRRPAQTAPLSPADPSLSEPEYTPPLLPRFEQPLSDEPSEFPVLG